ncbi:MAG: hypothetical protein M1826_002125 [Phylliscum demangeonii]|nr:MAG: hypothetical protein M1826_002125 [Phylliscum demangeonii]
MSTSAKYNDCQLNTCSVTAGTIYQYRPSLGANATLLILFALSLIVHVGQGWRWRTWAFTTAVVLGCITEIIGYAGRLMLWHNPFSQNGFLMQIVALTMAPAFFAAAVYLCISRVVRGLGPEISRLAPRAYMLIFIPCDVVSLSLQGAGGGISSVQSQAGKTPTSGRDIMIAGLAFQVATLALFIALCLEYLGRYRRAQRQPQPGSAAITPPTALAPPFHLFLAMLALATVCIFIRSVYRVVELSGGWDGKLIHQQAEFIVLEGVMVILACAALNVGHPGRALGRGNARPAEKISA